MGLLGKLFGGSGKKENRNSGSRAKRGRAPSIRQIPLASPDGEPVEPEAPLPEISLDDIEQQNAPASPPASDPNMDPIPVDFEPAPETTAKPPAAPPRPKRQTAGPDSAPGPRAPGRRSTRLQSRQKPLGEILIQGQFVSTEQLSRALKIQDSGGKGLIGQILVNMGACPGNAISQALSRQFRISTVELSKVEIPDAVAALVPEEACRKHRMIPFEKIGKLLCLAMANCLNRKAINEIEETTKLKVKPFNCSWIEIREHIKETYKKDSVRQAAISAASDQAAATAEAEAVAAELESQAPDQVIDVTDVTQEKKSPAPTQEPVAPVSDEPDISDIAPPAAKAAVGTSPKDEETRPFTGPARAVIEGLDDLDGEGEVVKTTERGLASKHLEARQQRREQRARFMDANAGRKQADKLTVTGPDQPDDVPGGIEEPLNLRQVEESEIAGVELPVAEELASDLSAFAPSASSPEITGWEPEEETEAELVAAHGAEADHDTSPQTDTVAAAAGSAARDKRSEASRHREKSEPEELDAVALSEAEWAAMESDLEPDPLVDWLNTYASAGPVPARKALI